MGMKENKHEKGQSQAVWKIITVCLLLCLLLCGCGADRPDLVIGEEAQDDTGYTVEDTGTALPDGGAAQDNSAPELFLYVYVCGAVEEPGVVALPDGSRAFDAVLAAGGMTEAADPSYVNLAEKLKDGEKLYVPTVEEASAMESGTREAENGLVNINTADAATLCTLPGIGESRAADIIAYREAHGAFNSIEDIMKVPGIKDAAFGKIRDRISVG